MIDAIIDALIDSLKVFGVVFIVYVIISFLETKIVGLFAKERKLSPLYGSLVGLVPQCGVSVVAADLFNKKRISLGALIAVFVACSDEAVPIMLADATKFKIVVPFLLVKFVLGFVIGSVVDLLYRRKTKEEVNVPDYDEPVSCVGCCGHEINGEEGGIKKHLLHPLIHSLKIFVYVLIVNIIFSALIYYIGEETLIAFLNRNEYAAPFFASLIGLIPNCAASVVIGELYLLDGLSFGATLAGLIANAGLGLVVLLKNKNNFKTNAAIILILLLSANICGYIAAFIGGF